MTDREFLTWLYERMVFIHKEDPMVDYMHRFRDIIIFTPETVTSPRRYGAGQRFGNIDSYHREGGGMDDKDFLMWMHRKITDEDWDNISIAELDRLKAVALAQSNKISTSGLPEGLVAQPVQEEKDPWKHRSTGMKCKTCMWFVEKAGSHPAADTFGRCRRHSPAMSGYPAVFGTDWCGDHKLDENKVKPC